MRRSTRTRLGVALAGVLALAVTLSACSAFAPAPPVSTTSTPTGESVEVALAPFYSQVLRWTECGENQCTTASAPLNWADPAAGAIDLALVRHPATSTDRVGSLLVNPGGPGASGFDFISDSVDYATDERLQAGFDIVGFDPRGVGRSTAVSCYDPAGMDSYLYDIPTAARGTDAWIAELEASSKDFGAACEANTGALLANLDTVSAARDLDLLRAVLGDDTLNYLGYSYGTFLGATYAELYPDKVGRLVFDGALDPSASNFDVTRIQAVGFENALKAYLTDCLDSSDCPFSAESEVGSGVGVDGTVDGGMDLIGALLDNVDVNPITATDGRQLGANTLLTAIITPLYQADAWPTLSDMFESVLYGDADPAFQLADLYNGRSADGSYSDNSTEAFTAVNCLDYSYNDDPDAMRAQAAEIEADAPVIGKYLAYGDIGCANWPYAFQGERDEIAAVGAAPILVVGTTNDPATPYIWAQELADQLESGQLVTYTGEGHTAYNKSNACVNGAVDDYLLNGTVPSTDPQC